MISKYKDERVSALISELAGQYFNLESNRDALITITRTEVENRGKIANIFFTVLPDEKEPSVLEFANRRRKDFRKFLTDSKSFGFAPNIRFFIDQGEKNRQKIDKLIIEDTINRTA